MMPINKDIQYTLNDMLIVQNAMRSLLNKERLQNYLK